mgnify:CR=1 FL=1
MNLIEKTLERWMFFEVCKFNISNPSCVPSWLRWAPSRSIFEHFGLMVWPLKLILGSSLGLLRPLWNLLGLSWGILEPPWSTLELPWGYLGASWSHLDASRAHLGAPLDSFWWHVTVFCCFWEPLECNLDTISNIVGPIKINFWFS